MASEWALMRALAAVDVLGPKPGGSWSKTVEKIAAALDEAPELLAENEELMEAHQALGHEYEMLARERDKLQADLDAALLVCTVLGVQYGRAWLSEEARKAGEHVAVLLEKRREKRG